MIVTITQVPTEATPTTAATPTTGVATSAYRSRPPASATERIGRNVLHSEWTKLRTVRSTYWTLLGSAAAIVGISAIVCSVYAAQFDTLTVQNKAAFNPISTSLVGIGLAQLAIGVLGVLVITNEYASGMIRSTLAATPQRFAVLAAKAVVFAVVTFVVSTIATFIAFFVGQAILANKDLGVSISSPGALRGVIGTGSYLATMGLLSLGLGTLIRKTAGAISALFGILLILPVVVGLLPGSMSGAVKYLPSNAGQALVFGTAHSTSTELAPWVGFGLFCLYAAASLALAAVTLLHRDA